MAAAAVRYEMMGNMAQQKNFPFHEIHSSLPSLSLPLSLGVRKYVARGPGAERGLKGGPPGERVRLRLRSDQRPMPKQCGFTTQRTTSALHCQKGSESEYRNAGKYMG